MLILEVSMARRLVIGFSTQEMQGKRGWTVYDIDLIKRDLLNHFHTRKGERVMLPTYGTIIWDKLFDPFTEMVKQEIVDDVIRIVRTDTRVSLKAVDVSVSDHGIKVAIELKYEPWDAIGTFALEFDRRSLERI
jgi:phage baseplate assembly protein W